MGMHLPTCKNELLPKPSPAPSDLQTARSSASPKPSSAPWATEPFARQRHANRTRNSLPDHLRVTQTLDSFKTGLKTFVFRKAFLALWEITVTKFSIMLMFTSFIVF